MISAGQSFSAARSFLLRPTHCFPNFQSVSKARFRYWNRQSDSGVLSCRLTNPVPCPLGRVRQKSRGCDLCYPIGAEGFSSSSAWSLNGVASSLRKTPSRAPTCSPRDKCLEPPPVFFSGLRRSRDLRKYWSNCVRLGAEESAVLKAREVKIALGQDKNGLGVPASACHWPAETSQPFEARERLLLGHGARRWYSFGLRRQGRR